MEYYSAIKKNEVLPSATWMDLEGTVLSEVSQTGETNAIWFHLYVEPKKKQSKCKWTNKRATNSYREHVDGCQMGGGLRGCMGDNREAIKKYKLVGTK